MGRLKSDDTGARRTAFIGANLTPYERAEVERRAALCALKLSEFVRLSLLSKRPGLALRPRLSNEAARDLARELARAGTNLNQLARVANGTGAVPERDALLAAIDGIVQATEKLIAL